ncbi:MAG: TrmH family RNA methyltransferase [Spirochaetales bacterium]|nr:TrmH family RNA methyltransferase [Spirochaetales bacterium]
MITLRKLLKLSRKTRLRKAARLLQSFEMDLARGKKPDQVYLKGLVELSRQDLKADGILTEDLGRIGEIPGDFNTPAALIRFCNNFRHILLSHLSAEPADWDLLHEETGAPDPLMRQIFPIRMFLEDVRSPFNVGAMFRTAESFGVKEILLSDGTADPRHPRAQRASMGCTQVVPWRRCSLGELEESGSPIFALELGGSDISIFPFPRSGTVIIGSEELGVSPEALALADSGNGRVTIPLRGSKGSLNVSVASGILLFKWCQSLSK